MRRRDFFKGLTGAVVALAVKPLAGLVPKARTYRTAWCPAKSWVLEPKPIPVLPRRLHGKLEGWVLDADGLLSYMGQRHFVTYDSVTGTIKHEYITYTLMDEERGEIRATNVPAGRPFAPGDEIRALSCTGSWEGRARVHYQPAGEVEGICKELARRATAKDTYADILLREIERAPKV